MTTKTIDILGPAGVNAVDAEGDNITVRGLRADMQSVAQQVLPHAEGNGTKLVVDGIDIFVATNGMATINDNGWADSADTNTVKAVSFLVGISDQRDPSGAQDYAVDGWPMATFNIAGTLPPNTAPAGTDAVIDWNTLPDAA